MYNKGSPSSSSTERPSDSRRAYLREVHLLQKPLEDRQHIVLSNFCPIQRYYDTADKVLDAFLSSYEQNQLDDAYVLGKRFTSFSTDTLPTHSYYKSKQDKLKYLRNDNIRKVGLVVDALEDITKLMDKEEVMKAKKEIRRREDSAKEKILIRRKKMMEEHRHEKQQHQDQQEKFKPKHEQTESLSLEDKLNSKLNQWHLEFPKQDLTTLKPNDNNKIQDISIISNEFKAGSASILPPPSYDEAIASLPPPPPPPPMPIEEQPPLYPFVTPPSPRPPSSSTPQKLPSSTTTTSDDISTLKWKTREIYESLLSSSQIQIFSLSTHQGKNSSSTNGCTVIAPLVAIRHLSPHNSNQPTLPDILIENVIDKYAPPVLSKVRSKLGLEGDALIIPSDVHDYFIDEKLLHQDQFIGVVGGNIINKDHLYSLFDLFSHDKKKLAATLYFHEHVITILKVFHHTNNSNNNGKRDVILWYDVIDSMPRPKSATRTRCKNIIALEIALKQYAFEKFNNNDWKFINTHNTWQENMCDVDPRVFQAFVWSSREKTTYEF